MTPSQKDSLTLMYGSVTGFALTALLQLTIHQFDWAIFSAIASATSLAWALHRRRTILNDPQNSNCKE